MTTPTNYEKMSRLGRKRASDVSLDVAAAETPLEEDATTGKKGPKKHKPLPESKFGGMTEEEVCKLVLPDHMKPGLDIIFVSRLSIFIFFKLELSSCQQIGINPGLYSAYLGHHYCNANNHFCKDMTAC